MKGNDDPVMVAGHTLVPGIDWDRNPSPFEFLIGLAGEVIRLPLLSIVYLEITGAAIGCHPLMAIGMPFRSTSRT